jgi:hypothetical protein
MADPAQKIAFDRQVLEVYLTGLEGELETKLRELRRLRTTLGDLDDVGHGHGERIATVQMLAIHVEGLLVGNRVVRETLLQLRETARALILGLQGSRSANQRSQCQ